MSHLRARPHPAALLVGLGLLSAVLWGVRWASAPSHASGDTFWYTRLALAYSGVSMPEATTRAAEFIVEQGRGTDPGAYVDVAGTIDPRYPAIFASRPLYPVVAAAFVPLAGTNAMVVAALLAGVVFGLTIGGISWWVTGSSLASVTAVVLGYALPTGQWLAFMYADGWMLVGWTLALGAATVHLVRGGHRSLAAFAAALVLIALAKSANVAVLAAASGALAMASLVAWKAARQRATGLALVAVVIVLGMIVVMSVLGLPGLNETLQDYFTRHFASPDVADPIGLLLRRDRALAPSLVLAILGQPLAVAVAVVGLTPLMVRRGSWPRLWVIAATAPVLLVLLHPILSEVPRLMTPAWVSAALGGSLWAAAIRRGRGRSAGSLVRSLRGSPGAFDTRLGELLNSAIVALRGPARHVRCGTAP